MRERKRSRGLRESAPIVRKANRREYTRATRPLDNYREGRREKTWQRRGDIGKRKLVSYAVETTCKKRREGKRNRGASLQKAPIVRKPIVVNTHERRGRLTTIGKKEGKKSRIGEAFGGEKMKQRSNKGSSV